MESSERSPHEGAGDGGVLHRVLSSTPWSAQLVRGGLALSVLGIVLAKTGGLLVYLVPVVVLAYLCRIHPYLGAGTAVLLLHLAAVRVGGLFVALLGGVVDGGLLLWFFLFLLRPTTPDYHWMLHLSFKVDDFLDPATTGQRSRQQSLLVAFLGASTVFCFCCIPLGLTSLAEHVRDFREHPCEGIKLPTEQALPVELEDYLSTSFGTYPLPSFCQATQHGNVYELGGPGGTLLFVGTQQAKSRNVLYSFQEHGNQQGLRAHDFIQNPTHFTSVEHTPGEHPYLCFLASEATAKPQTNVYCVDTNLTFQKTKRLSLDIDSWNLVEMFGFGGRLWIRESTHRFHTVSPDQHMKVQTNDKDFSLTHGMLSCLATNPLLALSSLLIPVVCAMGSYLVLWKRGVPSAGATGWWSVLLLLKWMVNKWPPSFILLVVALGILYILVVLPNHSLVQHYRTTVLWLLYAGLYPTAFILEDPSTVLIVILVVSALAMRHMAVILVWWIVLVYVLQNTLVQYLHLNRGWAVLASLASSVGVAHIIYEYWGTAVSCGKHTFRNRLQRHGWLMNEASERIAHKDDDLVWEDDDEAPQGSLNTEAEAFLAGDSYRSGDSGSVSSRGSARSGDEV